VEVSHTVTSISMAAKVLTVVAQSIVVSTL
jgi:hypothetical protein